MTKAIYQISCKDKSVNAVYIGCTMNLNKRKATHKNSCNNPNNASFNNGLYKFIRLHGGWDNFEIITLEEFEINEDRSKMLETERQYINSFNCLNSVKLSREAVETRKIISRRRWINLNRDKHNAHCRMMQYKRDSWKRISKIFNHILL